MTSNKQVATNEEERQSALTAIETTMPQEKNNEIVDTKRSSVTIEL